MEVSCIPRPTSSSISPVKKYSSLHKKSLSIGKSKENLTRKEPVYEQLVKIMNKSRPDISEPVEGLRKKSPTRKPEEIDNSLYEDALRRASIHHEPEEFAEVHISTISQKLLARKLLKEIHEALLKFDQIPGTFNYESTIKVFQSLNLIKNSPDSEKLENEYNLMQKYWKTISENEQIPKEKLIFSILSIIGIYPSEVFIESSMEIPDYLDFQQFLNNLNYDLELKLHKLFFAFNENRRTLSSPDRMSPSKVYSFKPHLNIESEKLAKKKRSEVGGPGSQQRLEYFTHEKNKAKEIAAKSRVEKEEEEVKLCTFRPKILKTKDSKVEEIREHRTLALYQQSKVVKEVQIKTSQEIELEKNLSECTFAPNIKKKRLKEETSGLYSKSVQQQITRMQKAREEEARKKAILESGRAKSVYDASEFRPKSPDRLENIRSMNNSPLKVMQMIKLGGLDAKIEEVDEDFENHSKK